jgi:hypothetical protein
MARRAEYDGRCDHPVQPGEHRHGLAAQRCGNVRYTFGARQLTHLGDNVLSPPNKEELSKNG